jgi:uncharacterized coiled-coil protein SlyX
VKPEGWVRIPTHTPIRGNMAGYKTYVFGKDAYIQGTLPNFGIVEKKKMKKITVKERIKHLNDLVSKQQTKIEELETQLDDQNRLMERVRSEGNQLIDKYNKLAGKYNAIRSLVTNND